MARAFAGGPRSAAAVAESLGATLVGPDLPLTGVAPIEGAGPDELSFLERGKPRGVGPLLARAPVEGRTTLVVADPLAALCALLAEAFPEPPFAGAVHPTARLGAGVVVSPGAVVGADCEVGDGTVLFPNVVLYPRTRVGARCRLHAGVVLGADGFRYHPTARGPLKVPQVGGVVLGDDVEIGANSTVDRGFLSDTVVGDGCKLDNLVQIGHNCRLGRFVVIVAQTGLAGSCVVGDGALIGGQAGFAEHLTIGAGARVGARSAVHTDIPAGETWLGYPALPIERARRVIAALPELPEMWRAWRATR